jgi:Carboxypeptidase regulatory-like domain/TonB-dependent Receptor Plug Domain
MKRPACQRMAVLWPLGAAFQSGLDYDKYSFVVAWPRRPGFVFMLRSRSARYGWLAPFALVALWGQSDLATITGVVTDPAQAVMPTVTIAIRNVDTNIARTMQTNADGYFTVTNLPPGSYELIAEKPGFRTYRETGILLEVGQTLRSDVRLSVGSINDSIRVTAEIAPLNTENGAVKGDVILLAEIQDIPLNGRDFTDLALLVPGVAPNAQGGAGGFGTVNGARGDNNNFVVDGFNNRDPRGGGAAVRPNLDAMQEFKMEVSGYSAEYGKTAGAVLNMVLRSGTNQYHGSLFANTCATMSSKPARSSTRASFLYIKTNLAGQLSVRSISRKFTMATTGHSSLSVGPPLPMYRLAASITRTKAATF